MAADPFLTNSTHYVEDRLIVSDGSTDCPSADLCDRLEWESYNDYVRRHLRDHEIHIEFDTFEDAERNLGLWCFYYFHKHILGNELLTPWPFWEDHAFLANWEWHEDDLEMNTPKDQRVYRLPDKSKRRPGGDLRKQKKLEKPRETLKTTEGFAMVTWEHLRAYFVNGSSTFRVTVISSTRRLTKKRYILAAKKVWGALHGKLFDLFHGTEEYGPADKRKTRKTGLIYSRGAIDLQDLTISLRWLQDEASAFATHSLIGFGADSESTGERADLTVSDDACTKDNSDTFDKRQKVKGVFAEQEKQLEHGGRMVWLDTRKHLDDASGDIDKFPMRAYWHILHRKAYWYGSNGNIIYYWPVDGLGKQRIDEAYLEEQRAKWGERDFWNELMNEPQDPDKALFKREFFTIVDPTNAPVEVIAGLGGNAIAPDHEAFLEREQVSIRAYNACDPAGREQALRRNDETGILGVRLDRWSNIWIVYMTTGKWPDSARKNEIWACQQYNRSSVFLYEALHDSGVEAGFQNFAMEKSKELKGTPVMIPIRIVKPSTITTKARKIEDNVEPFARRGAIKILANAGSKEEIEKFITQFTGFLVEDRDEYPDVLATIIKELGVLPRRVEEKRKAIDVAVATETGVILPIGAAMKNMMKPKTMRWGRASGREN